MNTHSERHKSAHEARTLFEAYRDQPSEALRNRIVEAYLHIARIIALRFSGKGVEFDDLYQVASLALIKAVERFDLGVGVQFQSYATPKMIGEVKNYFRDRLHTMNMPRKGNALIKQIESARTELAQQLMRSPTLAELIEHVELPEAEVIEALAMQSAMYPSSLDSEGPDGDAPISAFLGREDGAFQRFETSDVVRKMMESLDETSRTILTERYFNERSQREVAELLGVSQMTISRAERKALARIRQMMQAE